ncbi:hypothetical protein LCGC14_1436180 [marine sediment metagenome]|uniref:Uncharacterized protein n=1 Tax=marine sediment metagenome TaxID=412755 RepID=A0A0F9JMM7_9ZZZZ
MAITRSVALNEMNFRGLHVNAATAAYTLVPSDSGVILFNDYGTDTTYTLPAVADASGKVFWIVNGEATTKTIISAPTACIKGVQAAVCTTITSKAIGDHVIITCDGTNYFVVSMGLAVWTVTA